MKKSLGKRLLVWIDQGANVTLSNPLNRVYGVDLFGNEDETISSVLGKLTAHNKAKRFRRAVDWVFRTFFGQRNHCWESIEWDEGELL